MTPATPLDAGKETILVVEDNPMVRDYVIAQLRGFGYTTIAAENAAEALAVVRRGTSFDLLFTDIIMPGGSDGSELAKEVRRLRPSVKVLFTSGYTDNAMVRQGRLDPGVLLLQKPYRRVDLSRMIRTALGGMHRGRRGLTQRGPNGATDREAALIDGQNPTQSGDAPHGEANLIDQGLVPFSRWGSNSTTRSGANGASTPTR